jgi:glycerol-3-phosphate dehydrogenase
MPPAQAEVAVVGAGVVGSAAALALARRGVDVALVEAEEEPGFAASGTNSGILHTGFDSTPGELETALILRAAELRDRLLEALGVPVLRCGALMRPRSDSEAEAVGALKANADHNRVTATLREDGALEVPGESVTDPVLFTSSLAAAAREHGARWLPRFRVTAIESGGDRFELRSERGETASCRILVNCAGLGAGALARLAGDDSFDVYPRKGEFLVFEPPRDRPLDRILLPVPSAGTKGVLVFPTVDGRLIAGPTAVDQDDPGDWSVRPDAAAEIVPKASAMYPALAECERVGAYAGLRPAGRGVNYVVGPSPDCRSLVNVAAIRSTGLTASPAIAERVAEIVGAMGVTLGPEVALRRGAAIGFRDPWWRRTAAHRAK